MQNLNDFERRGFDIVSAHSLQPLCEVRDQIYAVVKRIFDLSENDATTGLNKLHEASIGGAALNDRRTQLIREVSDTTDVATLLYSAFDDVLSQLIGPDVLAQRTTNLVIQQPGDPNPSEVHRDAPLNSPYEIVVWVPLVDCYKTKSMYVLPLETTRNALSLLDQSPYDWGGFYQHCADVGENVDVKFGQALIFWSGLLHGSHVNRESETRFSINIRYKSLFSPSGLKEQFEYFKILRLSPLTRLGLNFQREEALR